MNLDEMTLEPEEGGETTGPRDITREHQQWRAAIFARVGTTAKTVSEIQLHEMEKFGDLERRSKRI